MAARTGHYGLVLFVLAVFLPVVSSDPDVLQRAPGDNVTLSCRVDGDGSIRAVEWTRDNLKPYSVLYFSDGHLDPTNQHPSFKDRVELVDSELKDRDVSLFLRNVSINDSGTYECRVAKDSQSGRTKRADIDGDPIRRIQLVVTDSGFKNEDTTPTDGNNNNHVLLAVVLGLCFLAVVGLAAGLLLVCSPVVGLVAFVVWIYKIRPASCC